MTTSNLRNLYSKYIENDELTKDKLLDAFKNLSEGNEMFVVGQVTRTEMVYGEPQETLRIRPVKQPTNSDYVVYKQPDDLLLRVKDTDTQPTYVEVMGENKDLTEYVTELLENAIPFKEMSCYLTNLCRGTGNTFNIDQTYGGTIRLNEGQQFSLSEFVGYIEEKEDTQ